MHGTGREKILLTYEHSNRLDPGDWSVRLRPSAADSEADPQQQPDQRSDANGGTCGPSLKALLYSMTHLLLNSFISPIVVVTPQNNFVFFCILFYFFSVPYRESESELSKHRYNTGTPRSDFEFVIRFPVVEEHPVSTRRQLSIANATM